MVKRKAMAQRNRNRAPSLQSRVHARVASREHGWPHLSPSLWTLKDVTFRTMASVFFINITADCCQRSELVEGDNGEAGDPLARIRALIAVVLALAIGFAPLAGHAAAVVLKSAPLVLSAVADADCPHAAASVSDQSGQAFLLRKQGKSERKLPTTLKCCSQGLCCAVVAGSAPSSFVRRTAQISSYAHKGEAQVRSQAGTRLERPPKRA